MSERIDRTAIRKLGLALLGRLHAPIGRSHVAMRFPQCRHSPSLRLRRTSFRRRMSFPPHPRRV